MSAYDDRRSRVQRAMDAFYPHLMDLHDVLSQECWDEKITFFLSDRRCVLEEGSSLQKIQMLRERLDRLESALAAEVANAVQRGGEPR